MAKKRRPAPTALEVSGRDRMCVVTAQRARWKAAHEHATDEMIRLLRFIWMRHLEMDDRHKLNAVLLGKAMRYGLVKFEGPDIRVTGWGSNLLRADRRS